MTAPTETPLIARIKDVLAERSLLKHPFYVEWTEGTLPKYKIQEYARQYYHFEAAFPRFLSAIHTRAESLEVRQLLLDNLWDEEHGERNHPVLWLEFAEALGVAAADVTSAELNPGTAALIDHYMDASRTAPVAEALGTLFGYEGQVPEIAWLTIKGLSDHYGFRPDEFEFFSIHLVLDVAHAGAETEAIQRTAIDEDAVVHAVELACDRLHGFMDGCYAVAA
jgi:pyrroloquinoline-quinone synthase